MNTNLANVKADLRRRFKQARETIGDDTRQVWDKAIFDNVLTLPELHEAAVIFTYVSQPGEVDTNYLLLHLLNKGKHVLTPAPNIKALPSDGLHRAKLCDHTADTVVTVPFSHAALETIDIIFVPGIAWDKQGYRVGFGGGYFDRLLADLNGNCLVVGLAYNCQLTTSVPRGEWDMPVHVLITEQGIISTR